MELLERFKKVLKDSKISNLEMSFTFQTPIDQFLLILDGTQPPTQAQEVVMFRFIMKELKIRTPFQTFDSFYQNDEAKSAERLKDTVMISKEDVLTIVQRIERDMITLLKIK